MTNPFDDLESDDDADDAGAETSIGDAESPPTTADASAGDGDTTPTTTVTRDSREQPSTETSSETDAAGSGPAFEYSEVRQKPLYARDETWTEFEKNVRTTITPTLAEADVVDEETREIHDAVLRLANQEPERVAELVLEARQDS